MTTVRLTMAEKSFYDLMKQERQDADDEATPDVVMGFYNGLGRKWKQIAQRCKDLDAGRDAEVRATAGSAARKEVQMAKLRVFLNGKVLLLLVLPIVEIH